MPIPPGKNTEQDVIKQKITRISSTSTPPIRIMWAWVEANCAALAAAALAFLAAALRAVLAAPPLILLPVFLA